MNLKSIITTAGLVLLSMGCIAPLNGAEKECTFVQAIIYGPNCWIRIDSCGHVEVHGCGAGQPQLPTKYTPKSQAPRTQLAEARQHAQGELPKGAVFVPDTPACAKGAE
jgi:hypothetical protein